MVLIISEVVEVCHTFLNTLNFHIDNNLISSAFDLVWIHRKFRIYRATVFLNSRTTC